jgi:hypothetical protein
MNEKLRVTRILWAAFLMSQLMFPVVAFVMPRPPTPAEPIVVGALGMLAVGLAVMSFVVPSRLRTLGLRRLNLEVSESVAADADRFGGFYRDAAAKQRAFVAPTEALARAYPTFQTSFIFSVALSEAVTMFGLPLAAMGFSPTWFVPFFVVGALLVAIRYPSAAALRQSLERVYSASLGTAER